MNNIKKSPDVDRREFIKGFLSCGTFLGLGCPGLLGMNIQ